MEIEYTKQDVVQYHTKLNELRAQVFLADWEPDKAVSLNNGKGYRYVSIRKLQRNIAPLMQKAGMDYSFCFSEPNCKEDSVGRKQWTVKMDATVTDCDTGYSETTTTYGGCSDGDKAVTICQVFALKNFLSNMFMITDFDEDSLQPATGSFTPKTPAEEEVARSKVLSAGVKPTVPAKPEVKAPAKPVVPAKPTPVKPAEPKVEEKPAEEPKVEEKPVEAPKTEEKKFKPSAPQQNVINKITAEWNARAQRGEVTVEQYNAMSADCALIACTSDVTAFIKKYKSE